MQFDTEKYKVYTWKNWMMLHWIINPGLAINELILGQRIAEVTLEDKTSKKPRIERNFTPCPHCNTIHDSRIWSKENGTAFKNWFGLYCKNCGEIIPCIINVFTFLILAITYPIWGWFRKTMKANWLAKQPARYESATPEKAINTFAEKGWIKAGLLFGAFTFIFTTLITTLLFGDKITWVTIAIGIPIYTIAGLGWGYFMKKFMGKQGKKTQLND